jgi:ABC-type glycerol-3-phosphate transport system substrate-binding protein
MVSANCFKMIHRTLMATVVLVASAASVLAEPMRIDFWTEFSAAPEKPALNEIVADFHKVNLEIQIIHTSFENTPYETTLKTSFAGGNPADIVELNVSSNMFPNIETARQSDRTDFVQERQKLIAPNMESWYTFRGKHCGVLLGLSVDNLLWYMKACGLPPRNSTMLVLRPSPSAIQIGDASDYDTVG